ncbi:MAG: POTRA domain-containing protein, partial [Vicinamibacteria bacterium]
MVLRIVLALAIGGRAAAQESATETYRGRILREVRIEPVGGPAPEASRELIELVPGDSYRPESVRRSIQQLFSLGAFSDIKVEAIPVGDEVDVVFRLFPRLEVAAVEIEGLERTGSDLGGLRSRLVEVSRLQPGDPFDIEALGSAAERMGALLRKEGYLWARVEPEASFQSPTAAVVFHVDAGARALLGALEVEGVPPHVETHIRRELALVEGAPYSRSELDGRIEALSSEWKELGFYGASVDVEERPSQDARVDVRITADMGPMVRIEVRGWDFTDKEIRKLVPLFSEARFTEDLVEESRANLEEHLAERGYL